MKRKGYTEEKIISIPKEHEAYLGKPAVERDPLLKARHRT